MPEKLTTEQVIERCKKVRGTENFDYSKVVWGDSENINVICRKHGMFPVRYFDFLKGVDCKECRKNKRFIEKAKKIHPDFDYSKTEYVSRSESVIVIIDNKEYTINPKSLLEGKMPRELSIKKRALTRSINRWKNIQEEFKKIHNNKYEYDKEEIEFIKSGKAERNFKMHIKCPKHGIFEQTFFDHRNGSGCKRCAIENMPSRNFSKAEKEILNYLSSLYNGDIEENNRSILNGKELDIYIPEFKIAIEYDGLFWHNNIDNSYKFELCRNKGIRLIRITEPEWVNNNKKIKYFLKAVLGMFERKISADDCIVKELSEDEYKEFCNHYSLYNGDNSLIQIGLFFNDELVEVMGLKNLKQENKWIISGECSKQNTLINDGKKKILNYFEEKYKPKSILVLLPKDKFSKEEYNDFELVKETKPKFTNYNRKYKTLSNSKYFFEKRLNKDNCKRLFDYGKYVFIKN